MSSPSQKPNEILLQEKLERRILHGLSCEWENTVMALKPAHRQLLCKPLFSLQNMDGRWGYWSLTRNEICLSRKLVHHYSWAAVCEILRHEISHQFSEQVLNAQNEPPHGPSFHRACHLLRANPKASGNFSPVDNRIAEEAVKPEDRILIRVKKLMNLAQSRNQHEAESAMLKAHELIRKYNVNLLSRQNHRQFVSIFVGKPALRHFREHYHLSNLLQKYYFIFGIWVPAYVLEKGKMGRVLEITGTPQNVRIAAYVHDFIEHFINAQWQEYNRKKRLNRHRKTDFAVGVIQGFQSKLRRKTKQKPQYQQKPGLLKISDPLLQQHVRYLYPRMQDVRGSALKNDKFVLHDGIQKGKELIIHKGISIKATVKKLLRSPR